jgi:hypothetical protein
MPTTYTKDPVLKQPPAPFTREDGWGVDLDPKRRPMYPMELPSDVTNNVRGNAVPPRQVPTVRIHQSTEHPDLTPVFGTSCPPRGLSGKIRDAAYKFSEGRLSHWMLLLLADRVDVVEGMLDDVAHGRSPGYIRDRGLRAVAETGQDMSDGASKRRYTVLTAVGVAAVVGGILYAANKRRG